VLGIGWLVRAVWLAPVASPPVKAKAGECEPSALSSSLLVWQPGRFAVSLSKAKNTSFSLYFF
jgi:hypothetical protein